MDSINTNGHGYSGLSGAVLAEVDDRPKRKRDRTAKEHALIQAALKLFAEKGYEATTTREIAASAGCAEGLIHRYFHGKAGLLPALVEYRISKEAVDINQLRPASNLQDEILQLVDWEIERMWEDREYLRVFVPRALLDPQLGSIVQKAVVPQRSKVFLKRLSQFAECRTLTAEELDALATSVGILAFVLGFMRPMVLGQDREQARSMARAIAKLLVRGI